MNRTNSQASSCISEEALISIFHPPRQLAVWLCPSPTGSGENPPARALSPTRPWLFAERPGEREGLEAVSMIVGWVITNTMTWRCFKCPDLVGPRVEQAEKVIVFSGKGDEAHVRNDIGFEPSAYTVLRNAWGGQVTRERG